MGSCVGRVSGLGAIGILTFVGSMDLAVIAQESEADGEGAALEEMVVTGSRLVRPGLVSPIPVTSISAEEIDLSGATVIADYLGKFPGFGINQSRITNVGGDTLPATGTSRMNLRDLGVERTLSLVDGRRQVGSVAGSTAFDVGSVPISLIERVEVSTGGASVAYGADAVAGVVNFVMKRDFEGVEFDARYGDSQHGGGSSEFVSLTVGANFANGRGNAVINATYNSEDGIEGRQRDWLRRQFAFVANPAKTGPGDGIPAQILAEGVRLPFASDNGNLLGLVTGETMYINDDGQSVRPFDPGTHLGGAFAVGGDGVNVLALQQIANPIERVSLLGRTNYALSNTLNAFLEAKYYNVQASNISQAQFDPFIHFEFGTPFFVHPENPFLPHGDATFDQFVTENNGLMLLSRWHNDLGSRRGLINRDTHQVLAGIEGQFGQGWAYDLFMQYGRTTEQFRNLNNRDPRRFRLATDVVVDVTGATGVPPGSPACRATVEAALSESPSFDRDILECRPVNLFGRGLASQESIDYFEIELLTNRSLEQVIFGGVLTGNLIELPSGPLSIATGFEYRDEQSDSRPDQALVLGRTFLGGEQPISGSYDVIEGFLEGHVPILRGKRFAEVLSVEGGVRISEYSTIGNTVTWRAGMEWAPFNSLRFRGMYADAKRSPNISELFRPQQEGFASIADPCDRNRVHLGPDPETRLANCTADLARFGLDPLTWDDPFQAFANSAITGGNPDLSEEKSNSKTFGFVFAPEFWDGRFSASLDYYDIEIRGAIASPSANSIIGDCYDRFDSIDNPFCALFDRQAAGVGLGQIQNIVLTQLNLDALSTSGIDFEVNYHTVPDRWLPGTLGARVIATYLESFDFFPSADATRANKLVGSKEKPRWRGNAQLIYHTDSLTLSYLLRYVHGVRFTPVREANPSEERSPWRTGSKTVSDISMAYNFGPNANSNRYEIYLGINNLFDTNPPKGIREGNAPNSTPYYDPIGRFYYGGVRIKLR